MLTRTTLFVLTLLTATLGMAQGPAPASPQELFSKAEAGDPDAMFSLGMAYWNGTGGVTADLQKAKLWMDRAVEKGSLDAEMFLGMAYFSGTTEGSANSG